MGFLIGFLGAMFGMALFITGGAVGYYLHGKFTKRITAEALTEAQKQSIAEEQEAWKRLHNYSVDDAYAVKPRITTDKE